MDLEFPAAGRLAAVDYGTVRIGIAICDPGRLLVSPLTVHQRGTEAQNARFFQQLTAAEGIAGFVVGLPIHCDGGESQKSRESRDFARWLQQTSARPVRLFDERFTTAAATGRLRTTGYSRAGRKKRLDAIAAQVLLEAFLEAARYHQRLPGQPTGATPEGGEPLG